MDTSIIVNRIKNAGLTVTLSAPGKIQVKPRQRITDELRQLIRDNKAQLMAWLEGTQLPTADRLGVSPVLKAASRQLDAQIIASGGSLDLPPDISPENLVQLEPAKSCDPQQQPAKPKKQYHPLTLTGKQAAALYNDHHTKCVFCQAAGRGSQYGQRCGTGQTLWAVCQAASD